VIEKDGGKRKDGTPETTWDPAEALAAAKGQKVTLQYDNGDTDTVTVRNVGVIRNDEHSAPVLQCDVEGTPDGQTFINLLKVRKVRAPKINEK